MIPNRVPRSNAVAITKKGPGPNGLEAYFPHSGSIIKGSKRLSTLPAADILHHTAAKRGRKQQRQCCCTDHPPSNRRLSRQYDCIEQERQKKTGLLSSRARE